MRVGSDVKTHKVGDRVALEPGVSCRTCSACKVGPPSLFRSLLAANIFKTDLDVCSCI